MSLVTDKSRLVHESLKQDSLKKNPFRGTLLDGGSRTKYVYILFIKVKQVYKHNTPIKIVLDNNQQYHMHKRFQKGYHYFRMLFETAESLPKTITFIDPIDNTEFSTIHYNQTMKPDESINDIIWESENSKKIKQRLYFYKEEEDISSQSIQLIAEHIQIRAQTTFPNENECKYLCQHNIIGLNEAKFYNSLEANVQDRNIYSSACEKERNVQIYYDAFSNIVYGVDHSIIKHSKVFFFDEELARSSVKSQKVTIIDASEDLNISQRRPEWHGLFTYQNITNALWLARRYYHIKNECLYGQDSEFNIFRYLCFSGSKSENDQTTIPAIALGLICVALQIFLTVGVFIEVVGNWDTQKMLTNDTMIICISCLAFTFISGLYTNTVIKYYNFYNNMYYVFDIDVIIKYLDFIANILIGLVICLLSIFYLLQSADIATAVLNSFALTFIIELDDLANMFDSDEDVLLKEDFVYYAQYIKTHKVKNVSFITRRIAVQIGISRFMMSLLIVVLSPLYILYAIFKVLQQSCRSTRAPNLEINKR